MGQYPICSTCRQPMTLADGIFSCLGCALSGIRLYAPPATLTLPRSEIERALREAIHFGWERGWNHETANQNDWIAAKLAEMEARP